jgi:hypothetical protein
MVEVGTSRGLNQLVTWCYVSGTSLLGPIVAHLPSVSLRRTFVVKPLLPPLALPPALVGL